jgi:putative exosortase-associated protein (TIGR04073 family)
MTKSLVAGMTIAIFVALTASLVRAESVEEEKVIRPHVHKFSRGLVNIGSAPLEIPKQMIKRAQEGRGADEQIAGYLTGTVTGIGWCFWRLGSGIVDVLSVPFSGNEKGLIEPEFISEDNPLTE